MKIDKNIPIPQRMLVYPWDKMDVGDSILVPVNKGNSALSSAKQWSKKYLKGMSYCIRKVEDGHRIWRTK